MGDADVNRADTKDYFIPILYDINEHSLISQGKRFAEFGCSVVFCEHKPLLACIQNAFPFETLRM